MELAYGSVMPTVGQLPLLIKKFVPQNADKLGADFEKVRFVYYVTFSWGYTIIVFLCQGFNDILLRLESQDATLAEYVYIYIYIYLYIYRKRLFASSA